MNGIKGLILSQDFSLLMQSANNRKILETLGLLLMGKTVKEVNLLHYKKDRFSQSPFTMKNNF